MTFEKSNRRGGKKRLGEGFGNPEGWKDVEGDSDLIWQKNRLVGGEGGTAGMGGVCRVAVDMELAIS